MTTQLSAREAEYQVFRLVDHVLIHVVLAQSPEIPRFESDEGPVIGDGLDQPEYGVPVVYRDSERGRQVIIRCTYVPSADGWVYQAELEELGDPGSERKLTGAWAGSTRIINGIATKDRSFSLLKEL